MLGSIDTSTDFLSKAHSTTASPQLDLNMNLDPASIFTVTRGLAVKAGLDVAPLDGIVELGGIQYLTSTARRSAQRRDNIYTSVFHLVLRATSNHFLGDSTFLNLSSQPLSS